MTDVEVAFKCVKVLTKKKGSRIKDMKKRFLLITFVLLACVFMFTGCGKSESKWNDGEYEGTAEGMHGELGVNVTIEDGKISKIDIVSQAETEGVSDVALERVPEDIIDKQSTEVDTVSGATESSKTIIATVEDALGKAEK